MKIIHRNEAQAPTRWKERCRCGHCDSVLEVEESDLTHYQGFSPRGNESWNYMIFKCPCCAELNNIEVPRIVSERSPVRGESPGRSFHTAKLVRMRSNGL